MRFLAWFLLFVAVVAIPTAALLVGHADLSDPDLREALLVLRGWRSLAAALAGAALAVAGVLVQGLFRNPLASPSVLGTSAGAALGGQLALLLHASLLAYVPLWLAPEAMLPLGCLLGAAGALAIVLGCAGRAEDPVALLLVGVILATFLAGCGALVTALAQDSWQIGRALIAFSLGGVDGAGKRQVLVAAPLVVIGIGAAWTWARDLDLALSGLDEASSLGVDTRALTRWVLVWTAILIGAAVAIGGGIAFVGLIVPHVMRGLVGHRHVALVPAAAIGGALFVLAADVTVRALPGSELPLGVLTALLGAPLFLVLLLRARRTGWLA
jgi:iron complex transport system permease protein